ncbi:helix-turn-helix transcriptional regulator [Micromonospora aurantiaca]|uniref:response regulator transcription factor n=1 Tax=Micromonospora aurantiaca (nom. illeg.) TaxID=47850 RepID=UPI0033B1E3A3
MIRSAAEILADVNGDTPRRPEPARPTLDPIDRYVLALLADGHTYTAIGRRIGKSKSATTMHLARLYKRLGARNAAHAVAITIRAGLLPAPDPGADQQ